MKKYLSFAAFALMLAAGVFTLAACGSDDDDNNDNGGGGSKFETQDITVNGVTFKMVAVQGDKFLMGAAEDDTDAYDDEKPQHRVYLSGYYIGETEVTQALWEAVTGENPSSIKGKNLPVTRVSHEDCVNFARKLCEMTGKKFRLLTEAEWEYAARGGQKTKGYLYAGSNVIDEVTWFEGNAKQPQPVKGKKPNELGLYDMTGNVSEICQDDWGRKYVKDEILADPCYTTLDTKRYCVVRGGSIESKARNCRNTTRFCAELNFLFSNMGLRLAMDK